MKSRIVSTARRSLPLASALAALLAAQSAQAATYYWDGNNNTANFASASGTWAAPTTGTATSGWSTSNAGTTAISGNSITTLIGDPLNFGTDTASRGLGGGTITVSGTVDAASLRFGSQTTGNIVLSGGVINLAATTTIHVGAGSTTNHTISSQITGAGTSLTKTGNTLTLSGANTYTGSTILSSGTLNLGSLGALGTTPGVSGTSGVTIGGASAATLQSTLTGISIAAPITTANTGINSTISFGRATAAAGDITLNGAIGGNGNVIFTTPNNNSGGNVQTVNLGAAGTWAGTTTMTTGNANNSTTIKNTSGAGNVLPVGTVLTMSGGTGAGSGRTVTFDLNGQNQELAGLQNTTAADRSQRITSPAAATLTINNSADYTFGNNTTGADPGSGQLTGSVALTKKGGGTFTLASGIGHTHTGKTVVEAGILSVQNTNSLQNSAFDTASSIAGDATNGLQITVTTLTLGGLTGANNFSTRFTFTSGGYAGLTALTLNPVTGATLTYAADIGDGAGGMTLTKSGAGTQIFTVAQSYTGTTTSTGGALVAATTAALPGYNVAGKMIFNGGAIGGQVGGAGWTTGQMDTLLSNATKTSGALGIDTTNGNLTQWTSFTTTNFGPLGLNKLGANDLTLDQANTFTGATTVTQGTLTLTNALALQNSALVTTGAGGVVLSGVTTLNLAGLSGATGDLASLITGYGGVTAINLNTPAGALLSYGGNIAEGAAGMTLTKTGPGAQALTGTNSYTGATQIDGGILTFGNKAAKAGATATAAAAGSIGLGVKTADAAFYSEADVAALFNTNSLAGFNLDAASGVAIDTTNAGGSFDQTVALTAARSLSKTGTGTLVLSQANSYSGATDIYFGNVAITNNDSLGTTAGATTVRGSNGTTGSSLNISTTAASDLTIAEDLNFFGNTTGRAQLGGSSNFVYTFTGDIDVTSDTNLVQFSINPGAAATPGGVTLSGDITGTMTNGAVLMLRGGTLSGGTVTAANSITGNITLIGAGLIKTDANTWTIGATGKTYSASNLNVANGVLKMGVADYITASAPELIMGNSTGGSNGTLDLNGFNQTAGGITYSGEGVSTGTRTITSATAATLTVDNATDFTATGTGTNSVVLTGALGLTKNGVGTLALGGINTYTGDTTVNAGTLALADNAQLKFVLGATTGTNNSISGAGTVTLEGDFAIDTSAADSLSTGSWTLENVSTLTGAYGTNFSVIGFSDIGGNKWEKANGLTKKYTFDETTGILTLGPAASYALWIDGFFPGETNPAIIGANADPDKDGVANGVEMVVGGDPKDGMDVALLPTLELVTDPVSTPAIPTGDYLLFTYRRTDLSVTAGVTSGGETDTDLAGTWTPATDGASGVVIQVDDNFTFTPPAPNTDRVRVYVPRGANTELFGRLKVIVP